MGKKDLNSHSSIT